MNSDIPPLSFKEKMILQREKAMAAQALLPPKPPKPVVEAKPRANGRNIEDDIEGLETLIDECDITSWETAFCKSCLAQLKRVGSMGLSVKQAAIVDKLAEQYLKADGSNPTPKGNPPMQTISKPVQQRGVNNPKLHFDDMDDDIPF